MRSPGMGAAKRTLVAGITMATALAAVGAPAVLATSTTFHSAPNAAIPDNAYPASATDNINASSIGAGRIVTSVIVQIGISHTQLGDLTIKLQSPAGTVLALLERPQGDDALNNSGDAGADTPAGDSSNLDPYSPISFADSAVTDAEDMGVGLNTSEIACSDDAVCQYSPNPDQAAGTGSIANLAALDGQVAAGTWQLQVGDSAPLELGTFVTWTIRIDHQINTISNFASATVFPIGDNGYNGSLGSMFPSVISASSISPARIVTSITATVGIAHSAVGDLTVKLQSPSGTVLALVERPRGDDSTNNTGDSGADTPAGDTSNASSAYILEFSDLDGFDPENMGLGVDTNKTVCQDDGRCQFRPNPDQAVGSAENFAAFDGEVAAGSWTLYVGDGAPGETGSLVKWSLRIRHALPLGSCGAAPPFADVPNAHPFCEEIEWMKNSEISTGFNDGTYQPSLAVTRQAMSAFMARLDGAPLTGCTSPPFTDVPVSHPFCSEIKWMKDAGISTGFMGGSYQPSAVVTRQAMSAFMARLADAELPLCSAPPFTDVPVGHPFCEEIKWMNDAGISTGFDDGTYRPSIAVTRQAMSAFMQRVSSELP